MKSQCVAYDRAWRSKLTGRFCECGRPAVGNFQGYFECAHCRALESYRAAREYRRISAGTVEVPVMKPRTFVERFSVRVVETARGLVIVAHGEYHLGLGVTGK